MDTLFVISLILVVIVLVLFIYSFLSDIFSFFIAPIMNGHLDDRIVILHKMGLHESAGVLKAQFVYNWWNLIWR